MATDGAMVVTTMDGVSQDTVNLGRSLSQSLNLDGVSLTRVASPGVNLQATTTTTTGVSLMATASAAARLKSSSMAVP